MKAIPAKRDEAGQFYVLSHPMMFEVADGNTPIYTTSEGAVMAPPRLEESNEVFVVSVKGPVPRVIIHMVKHLENATHPDDKVTAGYASRVVDGISNADMALMLQGYQVD